jgi:epoxyqueuosine reductase
LGFTLAGVCDAAPTDYGAQLIHWLEAGRHGQMGYLSRNVEVRMDPGALVEGARSIVCVADRYAGGMDEPVAGQGRIARYARGRDYHKVIKKRLHALADELRLRFPDERFGACVDTAPLLEREHAHRAGLGAVGKNTLLIDRGVGSWILLGELVTTLELAPSQPAPDDPCGSCTRCIDACPTDAITPWSVDATRCISYLTIEHRTSIDEAHFEPMGEWIFGCDLCQEVCPHNEPTQRTRGAAVHPDYAAQRAGFDLLEVLAWDEAARRAAFTRSALKRAKLAMMKRNALIAAGNQLAKHDDAALRQRIEQIAVDEGEDPLVQMTAKKILARLVA